MMRPLRAAVQNTQIHVIFAFRNSHVVLNMFLLLAKKLKTTVPKTMSYEEVARVSSLEVNLFHWLSLH